MYARLFSSLENRVFGHLTMSDARRGTGYSKPRKHRGGAAVAMGLELRMT